jgi:hypothetical protein
LHRTALIHPAVNFIFEREYATQLVVHLPAYWELLGSLPPLGRADIPFQVARDLFPSIQALSRF